MFLHRLAPESLEDNPLWLVVLCDMMTNLMLFFLILFAYNRQPPELRAEFARTFNAAGVVDPKKPDPPLAETLPPDPAKVLRSLAEREGLSGSVEIVETEDSVRMRLRSEILFASGEGRLGPGAAAATEPLAALLAQLPNTVVVEGHTDSAPILSGSFKSNWELSVARSHAVVAELARRGIAPRRLVTAGYGEFLPVMDNNSPEQRARNRRVEIVVLRDGSE